MTVKTKPFGRCAALTDSGAMGEDLRERGASVCFGQVPPRLRSACGRRQPLRVTSKRYSDESHSSGYR
ncbi:hypothetical protein BURK_015770 [Burkholderia sp. SJ98]|jgi:hypothetical protein|nr:hypothetical protein BURK_015770 [Burkholderia sp. SJ98]